MHQVTGEYIDNSHWGPRPLKIHFFLNANQGFNPYTWQAPIHWEGTVDGERVRFIQIVKDALSINSFNWDGFPEKFNDLKNSIVEAIDEAMRTMD